MFQLPQVGALQQCLMLLDRPADLSLFAVEVAQNQVDLERVACCLCRPCQFVNRWIDLVGNEEIQPEHVMRRFSSAPPIDPSAVLELVAFPRLTRRQPHQERDESGEQ